MLDMKLTLLCAELPIVLLLVILLATFVVKLITSRRAEENVVEETAGQPADACEEQEAAPEEEQPEEQPEEEQPVEECGAEEEAAVAEDSVEENVVEESEQQPEEQGESGASYSLTGNSVVFERGDNAKQTWDEKYAALDEEKRNMLDQVFDHVAGEDGVRRLNLTSNVRVKFKTHELFKADIKRGVPVLNFMLTNTTLMRYVKESGTKKIKITPVTVKLNDNDDLQLALHTADMALEQAKTEDEYKKEKRKEQRREREQAKNAK